MSRRLAPHIHRTPLLRAKAGAPESIYVKCENLQTTGSFKVRGALGALYSYREQAGQEWTAMREHGVVTCSSGNFAQGLAHATAMFGLDYTVVVPDTIAETKLDRITHHSPKSRILRVDYAAWRHTMITSRFPELPGFFLSSESDRYVSLATATLAQEIVDDLPAVDAILVPYGGGNLAYSTATLMRAQGRAAAVYAVEVSTGAPLSASLRAGEPREVPYSQSFVDGIGASFVIPAQFHRLRHLLAGVLTVTPKEIAAALASLAFTDKLVCEGAGAASFAAALKYAPLHGWRSPCAVLSGGVIDPKVLLDTLNGALPALLTTHH